jgi:uncharacterized protein (UPF0276 family)
VAALPELGLGISTEFGAGREGLDVNALRRERPDLVQLLEIGADLERGIDEDAWEWVRSGAPTTYHFLDVNLEERESLDEAWIRDTAALARQAGAAWLCGDAGLWHVGPRDRGHGTLMPPVLTACSADDLAESVVHLRESAGLEVLPENPPAHVFLGELHLLDYFGRVAERADCGLLLDVAHVAAYQQVLGHEPLAGFDGFPLERVVEVHVAGGRLFEHEGRTFVEDDHGPRVLPAAWSILEHVLPRATRLRATIVEAERNPVEAVVPLFEDVRGRLAARAPA